MSLLEITGINRFSQKLLRFHNSLRFSKKTWEIRDIEGWFGSCLYLGVVGAGDHEPERPVEAQALDALLVALPVFEDNE